MCAKLLTICLCMAVLSGCIIAPDNSGTINMIFGGDDPGQLDPESVAVDGAGIYFRDLDVDVTIQSYGDDRHDFTLTVKNIGMIELASVAITVDMYFADTNRDTIDTTEYFSGGILPNEYKPITWTHYYESTATRVDILSARLNPSSYSEDDVVLPADPVITFLVP